MTRSTAGREPRARGDGDVAGQGDAHRVDGEAAAGGGQGIALDEASRERLAEIYDRSIMELSEALSPDLQDELNSLALPFGEGEVPSESELRIAKAQLVGWLEGLFHGIQATLMAQQIAARQQLEEMRQLPGGQMTPPQPGEQSQDRPGTYL